MSERPLIEVLARGVCIHNGMLLLCHTSGARNTYLPGGHVEFEESAATALAREIEEEMGCRAAVGRFLGAVEHRFEQHGTIHCEVNIAFLMTIRGVDSSSVPRSREGHIEFLWKRLADLPLSDLEPRSLKTAIPDWLSDSGPSRWASTY